MGMGDGEGVGGGVDAGVQRHLGGGGEVAVDHLAIQVDHGDHLRRDSAEVGPGRPGRPGPRPGPLLSHRPGPRLSPRGALRAGHGRLHPIEDAELPPLTDKRVLHLQCHFGADSLTLAQRGATVVGLDFSSAAIAAANSLASELGLTDRAHFIQADVYDAPLVIPYPHEFDLVFVTWGALCWLPDIARWTQIVAAMLRPGGQLYLAEGHPTAYVFDDESRTADGRPGWFAPYFLRDPIPNDDPRDYADDTARLTHSRSYNWIHPLGDLITSLIDADVSCFRSLLRWLSLSLIPMPLGVPGCWNATMASMVRITLKMRPK